MSKSNLLYPPVKVVRQNQTHVMRVLIQSEKMIDFLRENYATPLNRDDAVCYFDINLSADKSRLIATTNKNYLEVVGGYDNPYFNRKVKEKIASVKKDNAVEKNITIVNKDDILDRSKKDNQIFIGQVIKILPLEVFTKRNGEKAGSRLILVEYEQDEFTHQGLFEIYRQEKFLRDIDENFSMAVGDLVKIEYFMHVMEFEGKGGVMRYVQKNKVYRWWYVMDKKVSGYDPNHDNPFDEEIDVTMGTKFMSNNEKNRLNRNKN